jgi:hypothetical protein
MAFQFQAAMICVALTALAMSPALSSRCIPKGMATYIAEGDTVCAGGVLTCGTGSCRIFEYNKGASCEWIGIKCATDYQCDALNNVTQPVYVRNGHCNYVTTGVGGNCICQTGVRVPGGGSMTVNSCKEKCIKKK